jgi:hypothetical protein
MGSFVLPALLGKNAVLACRTSAGTSACTSRKSAESGLAMMPGGVHEQPT